MKEPKSIQLYDGKASVNKMKCFYCDKEATQKSTDIKSTVYHCKDCGF